MVQAVEPVPANKATSADALPNARAADLHRWASIDCVLVNVGYAPQRLTAMGRLPSPNHESSVAAPKPQAASQTSYC